MFGLHVGDIGSPAFTYTVVVEAELPPTGITTDAGQQITTDAGKPITTG
jgi:hypothetical protein